ncbi:uncharacterized protein [Ciconia boyciana]|uniref:uncharacterized protein n=1 Tax=Ciconia boyciana TaxID=52775 RepID=UPI003BA001AE
MDLDDRPGKFLSSDAKMSCLQLLFPRQCNGELKIWRGERIIAHPHAHKSHLSPESVMEGSSRNPVLSRRGQCCGEPFTCSILEIFKRRRTSTARIETGLGHGKSTFTQITWLTGNSGNARKKCSLELAALNWVKDYVNGGNEKRETLGWWIGWLKGPSSNSAGRLGRSCDLGSVPDAWGSPCCVTEIKRSPCLQSKSETGEEKGKQ